jgi:hypothetical protein
MLGTFRQNAHKKAEMGYAAARIASVELLLGAGPIGRGNRQTHRVKIRLTEPAQFGCLSSHLHRILLVICHEFTPLKYLNKLRYF